MVVHRRVKKVMGGVKMMQTYSPSTFYGVGYHLGYGYRMVYCILGHHEFILQLSGGKRIPTRDASLDATLDAFFRGD